MSVSIDMVWSALVFTIELCDQTINAPDAVKDVKKATKRVRLQVGEIKKRMGNPSSSFYTAEAEIKQLIQDDLDDIVKGTARVKQILDERAQIPWYEWGSYLFWVAKRLPKLQEVVADFDHSRTQIANVVSTFIHTDAMDKERKQHAKAEKRAKKKAAAHEAALKEMAQQIKANADNWQKTMEEAKAAEEKAAKERAELDEEAQRKVREKNAAIKKLKEELKTAKEARAKTTSMTARIPKWAEDNQKAIRDTALHPDDESRFQLVRQLVELGLGQKDAEAKVDSLLRDIRKEKGRTMSWDHRGGNPNAEKGRQNDEKNSPKPGLGKDSEDVTKTSSGDVSKKGASQGKFNIGSSKPANTNNPNQDASWWKEQQPKENKPGQAGSNAARKAQSEGKTVNTEESSILIVDSSNGVRSIMSQFYLELVRNWTMNTQKRWLFSCVDSAGLCIDTALNQTPAWIMQCQAGLPPSKDALAVIAGNEDSFYTKGPDEKQNILDRISKRRTRGLEAKDFARFDHIICFRPDHRQILETLKSKAARQEARVISKVHHIRFCLWEGWKKPKSEQVAELLKLRGQLKVALKQLLSAEFGWERPAPAIALGEWRTLQIVLPAARAEEIKRDEAALDGAARKLDVCLHIAIDAGDSWLLSLSGPSRKLATVQKLILGDTIASPK